MKELLKSLLNDMENIWDEHGELTDTVIRDGMREAIDRGFITPTKDYEVPDDFGMDSPEGNAKVKGALGKYIRAANAAAESAGLSTREQRLRAFQDSDVLSQSGYGYDEFFGHDDGLNRS